jgi:hypothetical protein
MMTWLTRLSEDHGLTRFALESQSLDTFVDRLFMRLLTRHPTMKELAFYRDALAPGYDQRRVATTALGSSAPSTTTPRPRPKFVAWSNHMKSEANSWRLEEEAAARRGDPATTRLESTWRQRFENVLWALLNAPEWTRIR